MLEGRLYIAYIIVVENYVSKNSYKQEALEGRYIIATTNSPDRVRSDIVRVKVSCATNYTTGLCLKDVIYYLSSNTIHYFPPFVNTIMFRLFLLLSDYFL